MKTRLIMFVTMAVLLAGFSAIAGPKEYGKKLTLKKTTKVSDILAAPDTYNGKRVLVVGPVTSVCEMRGCWIQIGSDKEFGSLQFKVEDGVIVFPMDAEGKTVKAEGVVEVKTLSVEDQLKQGEMHAKEMGEEFDAASVKGPKVSVRILGEGAVIE